MDEAKAVMQFLLPQVDAEHTEMLIKRKSWVGVSHISSQRRCAPTYPTLITSLHIPFPSHDKFGRSNLHSQGEGEIFIEWRFNMALCRCRKCISNYLVLCAASHSHHATLIDTSFWPRRFEKPFIRLEKKVSRKWAMWVFKTWPLS